jgi:hypothetical protein
MSEEPAETVNINDKNMDLAYEIAFTPRIQTESTSTARKKKEKFSSIDLVSKTFVLERSIKKINVMQTRNYLKKPYKKLNSSVPASFTKKTESGDNKKINSSSNFEDLKSVYEIFDQSHSKSMKKNNSLSQSRHQASFKLNKKINSFNNQYSDLDLYTKYSDI